MRRKPGHLLPLELEICRMALDIDESFHGYEMAKLLQEGADTRLLIAHGTLYRALARLEGMGLVKSRWEDPRIAARENRPGRRLYALTAAGETAVREAAKATAAKSTRVRRKWVPA
jgi:DNA-binding PadR family transcriptional regulator